MPEPARYPIGHYTWDVHWIRSHVGVYRGECQRCGFFVQSKEGLSADPERRALERHVCDPGRKSGPYGC